MLISFEKIPQHRFPIELSISSVLITIVYFAHVADRVASH